MARGTAHAPKPDGQRRRRNAPASGPEQVVERDGEVRGPELADATGRDDWLPQTEQWWDTWRRAPQAAVFETTDWMRLGFLATIVDLFHSGMSRSPHLLLAEIRMNEERLGATVTDRQRARIRITDEESGPALATVTPIAAARARWDDEGDEE